MSNETAEVIVNGKRYVPEESSKYVEATIGGQFIFQLEAGADRAEAWVLNDATYSRALMFSYMPVGTRVRITIIEKAASKEPG